MRIIEADLIRLRELVLDMGKRTEAAIAKAMQAVLEQDSALSAQVIVGDDEIDLLENEIDKLATDIMVLRQPAASDLRFTVTIMHTAPILERVADHAVNIAKHAISLNAEPVANNYADLVKMSRFAQDMLHASLDALLSADAEEARKTIRADDDVDLLYRSIHNDILELMERDPSTVKQGAEMLFIIKHLERIADYATNICEMVIYMIEGRVIKHTQEAS